MINFNLIKRLFYKINKKENCNNNHYSILTILLVFIASFLRTYNLSEYGLGFDEVLHLDFSNYKNFSDIIKLGYKEVHPPLNYLLIYIFTSIQPTILFARLPTLISGIALIILTYYLIIRATNSQAKALLAIIIISFGDYFIELSQGTRSYSLALTFLASYLLIYLTNKKIIYLLIFGFLAIISDYSAIVPILVLDILVVIKLRSRSSIGLLAFHIITTLGQKILLNIYSQLNYKKINLTLDYSPISILNKIYSILSSNLSSAQYINILIFFLIILGLLKLSFNKKTEFTIRFFPLIFLIVILSAHYLDIFPLIGDRYNISYSYIFLIFGILGLNNSASISLVLICLTPLYSFYISRLIYVNDDLILSKYKLASLGLKKDKYKEIETFIEQNNKTSFIGASTIKTSKRLIKEDFDLKKKIDVYVKNFYIFMPKLISNKQFNKQYICIDCTTNIGRKEISIIKKKSLGYGRYAFTFVFLKSS